MIKLLKLKKLQSYQTLCFLFLSFFLGFTFMLRKKSGVPKKGNVPVPVPKKVTIIEKRRYSPHRNTYIKQYAIGTMAG